MRAAKPMKSKAKGVKQGKAALNDKQIRFVEEYMLDLNATQAYIRSGYAVKNETVASVNGARLLADARVQSLLAERMSARADKTETDAEMVVRQWLAIATADPNDLVEFRRNCCRYCYGQGFRYQRTPAEREKDLASWVLLHEKKNPAPPFDEQGGVGFNPTREPNPDCPECFGEGYGEAFFKDTRRLPVPARLLYGGVQMTKDGIKVLLNSKEKALEMLARHNGMLTDKTELSGPDGGPIKQEVAATMTPSEAWLRLIKGDS